MLTNKATKLARFAVEFSYGNPVKTVRYLLNAQQPETLIIDGAGFLFSPMPGADLETWEYNLRLTEKPFTVTLPLTAGFVDQISGGAPFARTGVKVWEILDSLVLPGQQEILKLFEGRVAQAIRNYRKKANLVALKCISCKAEMNVPMGIPVNATCPWIFTSPTCGVVAVSNNATVDVVIGKKVTVTWLTGPVNDPEYYFRGYMEFDDTRIMIRSWDNTNPNEIGLVTEPPITWIGQSVTIKPGCDKTIAVCRDRWNNEDRFGGSGFKMPSYKPNFENPS